MNHRIDLGKNPYGWSGSVIAAILERVDYLGHKVNFKHQSKSYKCHTAVKRPKDEQMIFYNTHKPIISQEDWDMVQKIRSGRRRKNNTGEVNKFSGLLYCTDCGARLYYHAKPEPSNCHFQCGTYSYAPTKAECSTHYIREVVIEQNVLDDINKIISAANIDSNALMEIISKRNADVSEKATAKRKRELAVAQKRYDELDRLFTKIYEDNANCKISDKRFDKMSAACEAEQAELSKTISEYSSALTEQANQTQNAKKFLNIAKKYSRITELTPQILREFIDKIVVHAPDRSSERRVVQIYIHYNFIGTIG